MNNESKIDRVYIRKEDKKVYDKLQDEDPTSPFFERENREVYMVALARGFIDGERLGLNNREGFIRLATLKSKDKAIIKAIAVQEEETLGILGDKEKVYKIANEYAAGGLQLLKERVLKQNIGSYVKRLESELIETFDNSKVFIRD
ncbi:hypothetical protein AKJ51_00260 [candidate division MSBL1 archaeon SCGC-AAA382A20]|uniref:Uncharacterized protein n=1 Tax=candidate division MSBL1 archaeon SCGC-AAA382A20 TaxID=1698280 RepID=A0A133VMR1_9EURY|nr:hypothetical protein AKJ51_00260 [candidate division MSBL1 archaeon SCGC-AAA382A20]